MCRNCGLVESPAKKNHQHVLQFAAAAMCDRVPKSAAETNKCGCKLHMIPTGNEEFSEMMNCKMVQVPLAKIAFMGSKTDQNTVHFNSPLWVITPLLIQHYNHCTKWLI